MGSAVEGVASMRVREATLWSRGVTALSYLATTRKSYDTVAGDYAELVKTLFAKEPLGRAMLAAFAEHADRITELLSQAGMVVTARLLADGKKWPQACLLAQKHRTERVT
jgi:hypothetical protein